MYKTISALFSVLLLVTLSSPAFSQNDLSPIAEEVISRQAAFAKQPERKLTRPTMPVGPWVSSLDKDVNERTFFVLNDSAIDQLEEDRPQELKFRLQTPEGPSILLEMYQAEYLSPDFELHKSSDPDRVFPFDPGLHYRGIVNGEKNSLALVLIRKNEISGLIEYNGRQYNLGKVEDSPKVHMLYPADALNNPPVFGCHVEDLPDRRPIDTDLTPNSRTSDPNKCVEVYVVVDNDVYQDKGAGTENYVSGAFSQVIALYTAIQVNMAVKSILVWDTTDPFVGLTDHDDDPNTPPVYSTGTYLTEFGAHLNGNYQGADIAHLVGYNGGGGVAWQDILNECNTNNSNLMTGYSAIGSTYQNIPTYSWTVNVLAHEIGHNLASPHTHDCAWNGNNTSIDDCGPNATPPTPPQIGTYPFPDNTPCPDNDVIPNIGTIMSYCHLVQGVGISLDQGNNGGFHPLVRDLIQNRVYNSNCLEACTAPPPPPPTTNDAGISAVVEPEGGDDLCGVNSVTPVVTLNNYGSATLTSVTIQYTLDGGATQSYNWSDNLVSQGQTNVTLPELTLTSGNHTLQVSTVNPNGQTDENTDNDASSVSFSSNENGALSLSITFDDWPAETSWEIRNENNNVVAAWGPSAQVSPGVTATFNGICLPLGCYDFTIFDSEGDGICCAFGNGSYTLTNTSTNTTLASGGEFTNQETTNFCLTNDGGGGGTDCVQGPLAMDDNPIASNTYSTAATMTSAGTVPSANTVVFQAAQTITLQPGFHAQSGSTFTARIADCTPATLAQDDPSSEAPSDRELHFGARPPLPLISMSVAPNPFRNETIIRYNLEEDLPTQLILIDMLGRRQILQPRAVRAAGYQEYRLDGTGLSNGIYFVQLRAGEAVAVQKVQVVKN